MAIKDKIHKMCSFFTKYNNNGDVINGDKYVFNNYINKEETYEAITNDENYSDFYKSYIAKFDELDSYAFSLFYPKINKNNYSFRSKPLVFGKKIINWIYGLDTFPAKDIQEFYKSLITDFNFKEDTLIVKRWKANIAYFNNDLKLACDNYDHLYDEVIQKKNIPKWYLDDICIDGRNLLYQYNNTQNIISVNNKFQEKISSNNHNLSYPDIDRIKVNIYENVSKHIFDNETKSKYTTIFGIGLEEYFSQIQNLIFLAVFYGSITHLRLIRELIADIMYMYAETFEEEEFYAASLQMLFISGEYKKYRNLYNKLKLKYPFIIKKRFIDTIVKSRKTLFEFERDRADIFLFDIYGRYLDDELFEQLENKIFDLITISDQYQINLISSSFKAIACNIRRINKMDGLLKIIKEYFVQSYSRFYIDLGGIVNGIDINKLTPTEFLDFQFIIDSLLKEKGHLNFDLARSIVSIKNRDAKISKYDELINQEGSNENILYYGEKEKNEIEVTKSIIKILKNNHEQNNKSPGVYLGRMVEYNIGKEIFSEEQYVNTREFILTEYLPLAKGIITSENEIMYEKIKHIKLLSYMLKVEKDGKVIEDIVSTIHKSSDIKCMEISSFAGTKDRDYCDLEINSIMCDVISRKSSYSDALCRYLEIAVTSSHNIEEILSCVLILNDYCSLEDINIIDKLYILFKVCYQINDIDIRKSVIIMSKIFLKIKYQEKVLNILEERANYVGVEECNAYIRLILDSNNKKIFKSIIEKLKNNGNYYVKGMIDKYL